MRLAKAESIDFQNIHFFRFKCYHPLASGDRDSANCCDALALPCDAIVSRQIVVSIVVG